MSLADLSLEQTSRMIAAQELSPVELTRHALETIERHNSATAAFISVYAEEAMATARVAEVEIARGEYRGPLHGVPIGVKDNVFVKDRVATMGSRIHADFVPDFDAHAVTLLRQAGAVLVGKTNLHEYALGVTTDNPHYGTARNPWDLERTTGGSSGGSAAAVAAGMVPAALGSDTSGSIRIPAGACGLVGLKPSYGRISRHGCFPEAWSLDHLGSLTRTVGDAAVMLDAVSGHDPKDRTSLRAPATQLAGRLDPDLAGLRIGVPEEFYFSRIDPGIEAVVRAAIGRLADAGATIGRVEIPALRWAEFALTIIDSVEFTAVHDANLRTRPGDFGDDVRRLLGTGALPSAVDYVQAQQLRARISEELRDVFTGVDVLVAPTLPVPTPRVGVEVAVVGGEEWDIFDALVKLMGPANLGGLPAASVPCGMHEGLPVGLQIMGPVLGEAVVLNTALAVEAADPLEGAVPRGV